VEAGRTFGRVAPRKRLRVASLDRHGLPSALGEPDNTSVEHIDRREHF